MPDFVPPLTPEIAAWAIVSPETVGPPETGQKPGVSSRTVTRADGSNLVVSYPSSIDQLENPELRIAEKVNVLVMAGDLRVLDPNDPGPVSLA